MNNEKHSEEIIETRRSSAIEAYLSGDMSLFKLAEVLGMDTLSVRKLLHERGVQLHKRDSTEVPVRETRESQEAEPEEPSVERPFVPREWTIQSFRVDRWVDDTGQDRRYTFEEMKDALARSELLHFDVRRRGYNPVRKKIYEPM